MGGAGGDSSQGWSNAVSNSVGGSRNRQFSTSLNNSNAFGNNDSVSSTGIAGSQQPFLTNLWGQGQQYANPAATQHAATRAAAGMRGGLSDAFGNVSALTDPTQQIAAQEASLSAGLGNLFNNEIAPSLRRDAQASGGFGGGRQGVAEGVAAGELANAYTAGLGDITARANQTALGAGALMPAMAQSVFANAVNPTMAGLGPLGQLASIIGGPTVLSDSMSTGRSGSTSRGRSRARTRGGSYNRSGSTSNSGSKSDSFDFNILGGLFG